MTTVTIWERDELADPINEVIERAKEHGNYDLVMAQIPALFGDSDKATYLGFRALGFRARQALEFLGLELAILELWYEETPELKDFELERLGELQRNIGADIIRLQFLRNMTLFLFQDSRMVAKSLNEFNEMSNREFNYLKANRRFYTSGEFLNLQKAMEPEKHRTNTLVLNFGGQGFKVVEDDDGNGIMEVIDGDSIEPADSLGLEPGRAWLERENRG
jgi:hypothetical protein